MRSRNRRGQGSRLRDEIVVAAQELLDETGDEHAVTLRSVARRVGIAAPSIYPHFPDQPAIMLAVLRNAFAELDARLRAAAAGDDPAQRLRAVCHAYLEFARTRPGRYRTMFGGLWNPTPERDSVTEADLHGLGDGTMRVLGRCLTECVAAGQARSTDPTADTVTLWLGLHGLAHQRAVMHSFPWPDDVERRIIDALAHLEHPAR
ncbi:TetR/AcrR family transcriptional regulator [Kineosporia sp. J2-2]|uniref:TetR/AcrR family transcriptional regulator n=1 Tax=Kineosporia corallincola TaxID=2835133 RepID=A0ABS5TNY2_9ACTN|nr:TetR/AcrR family transcriptional regulator [Kineosporia corallincola]MBT0772805.1 TetR/AcrR family transcriptional regulator [Kineosporia corallincola]